MCIGRSEAPEYNLWRVQGSRHPGHALEVCQVSWLRPVYAVLHGRQARPRSLLPALRDGKLQGVRLTHWIYNVCLGKIRKTCLAWSATFITYPTTMDSSTIFQAPPQAAYFLWSCNKVYHKQEVCFLLYFLGQTVSWQYNPNLLD